MFTKILQFRVLLTYNVYMKKWKKILSTLLLIVGVCAVCFGCAGIIDLIGDTIETEQSLNSALTETGTSESDAHSEALIEAESSTTESVPTEPTPTPEPSPEPTPEPCVSPYSTFFEEYPDLVAWLHVPDTVISYPVMWTPGDETYYLYRNYDGTENQNGSLLLDTDSSLDPLTTNLIIHGHDMRSGAMFGNLTDYADETYCEQHKEMLLFTADCERKYEVIATFYSQVYRKKDTVFKFYQFFQADTEEEFNYFYDNIMDLALFDTGVTAEFGDRFITLSTCSSHVENGRFVVVAKEVAGDTSIQE